VRLRPVKQRSIVFPCLLMAPSRCRPATLLTGIEAQITHQLFAVRKAAHWSDGQHECQGGHRSHPWLLHQTGRCRTAFRFADHRSVQLLDRRERICGLACRSTRVSARREHAANGWRDRSARQQQTANRVMRLAKGAGSKQPDCSNVPASPSR
jgi:hypothetical protein